MNNEIKIFNSDRFGEIRTAGDAGTPMFCLADICKALELQVQNTKKRLKEDGVYSINLIDSLGREQQALFINEQNLYRLIMRSDKPQAEPFQDWVCGEVLPAIRKSGGYMVAHQDETPEQIMARALKIADEALQRTKGELKVAQKQNELLEASNKALTKANDAYRAQNKRWFPHYLFSKAVETSKQSILIGELAKIITQKGYEIGQNRLFEWMRENGYLISRVCDMYNQPTQRAMKMGLFEIKKTIIHKPNGDILVKTTPKVTGKGQIYFVERFVYEECNRHSDDWKKGGAK